jgi:hypothetical protein
MTKTKFIAAVIGAGMMLMPCMGVAQAAAADQTAAVPVAAEAAIPVDQQATKEQLTKLFELMQVKEHMAATIQTVEKQLFAKATQSQKSQGDVAGAAIASKLMEQLINPDEMLADMIAIYQKHLTRSDVDGMIAFYNSPAGQHWIAVQPVITKEYMPIIMKRVQERLHPAPVAK